MKGPPERPLLSHHVKVQRRFKFNIDRVNSLVSIFEDELEADVKQGDILRAAVVLLHATLEDALRGLLEWKLPKAPEQHLKNIAFDEKGDKRAITLAELTRHRTKTVEEVISKVIKDHIDRHETFNHNDDIVKCLERVGLNKKLLLPNAPVIAEAIARRHKIVHNSDRSPAGARFHGTPMPISIGQVRVWTEGVRSFIESVLAEASPRPKPTLRPPPKRKLVQLKPA